MPLQMYNSNEVKSSPLSSVKNVVGIAAGKGGVGKSSLTVNLAVAMHHLGYKVGIMDTDVYGPSVRMMLPEDTLPTQKGQYIAPAICGGIRMISMAYFRKENEAAVVRAPIANGIITQFIRQVQWGELDYLFIDFPPGTGDIQLTLTQQAPLTGIIMVTTPQEVAILDVRKAMHMFEQVKVPILGIVENMSYYHHQKTEEKIYIFGKGGGERLASERAVSFLGGIPIDPQLCNNGDLGRTLFNSEGIQKSTVDAFLSLAKKVSEQISLLKNSNIGNLQNFELIWKEMT